MSSEGVKLTPEQRAAIKADVEQNAIGAGVGDTLRLLSDYAALEAECERLRNAPCECGAPVGYVSGDKYAAEHERLRECRAERAALSAELAALKAASGEEVAVVGVRISSDGFGSYIADSTMGIGAIHPGDVRQPLMTVAQHQRITAALRGEVEQMRVIKTGLVEENRKLFADYLGADDEAATLRAELDAARKQEPVGYRCRVSGYGCDWLTHYGESIPKSKRAGVEYEIIYAAPPAAAMDGGMVEELHKQHDLAWDTAGTILEKLSKANVEVDRLAAALEQYADDGNWCYDTCNISRDVAKEALAANRQASQQEGE